MSIPELIGVLGGVVGLVGGLAGMAGTYYQGKQTRLMQEQIDGLKGRDTSYAEWTAKWEQAADALAKIYPGFVNTQPGTSTNASGLVFTKSLLQRIEHHLGKKTWTGKFQPKVGIPDDADQYSGACRSSVPG